MNLAAPVTVLAVVFAFASNGAAQGFRGFATGGGNSSGSGQSGMIASPTRSSGASGPGTIMTTPGTAVMPSSSAPVQTIPQAAVPQYVPPVIHGGGVPIAAPHGTTGSATFTTAPTPGVTPTMGVSVQSISRAAVPQFVPPVIHGGGVPIAAPRGTTGSATFTTAPTPALTSMTGGSVQSTPRAAVPRFVPPVVHGGNVGGVPANPQRHPPGVIVETHRPPHRPPPLPFRPPFLFRPAFGFWPPFVFRPHSNFVHFRNQGIVILDSPYYWPNTVITEMAPGVVEERRYVDEPPAESRTRYGDQLAPFDPTPPEVVERMLRLAAVKPGDLLYDLGAGDGRVVIAAAKKYGIKAVGFEIDPGLVKLARENVRKQGVEHLVEIRQEDFLTADLSLPSVVTLYLSYDGNLAVRPRLMSQLKSGARVVSYTFDMAEWQPKVSEGYRDAAGNSHIIYLWEIGGPLVFGDLRP
jgi:precorrin-6B methylase 2